MREWGKGQGGEVSMITNDKDGVPRILKWYVVHFRWKQNKHCEVVCKQSNGLSLPPSCCFLVS